MMKKIKIPVEFHQEKTILIIDDEPANIRVLTIYLEASNFKVLSAANGLKGLELAETIQPDLILLDIMMPGLNGFETCRRLKTNELTKKLPVIFITALNDISDKIEGFTVGAVDYIDKPFRREELLARVVTHLRIGDLTQSLQAANQALANKVKELEALQAQLIQKERLAVLGQLTSGVAHELRNPLGVMSNAIYFLKLAQTQTDITTAEYLQLLTRQINEAEKIISGLLIFSDTRPPLPETTSVEALVKSALEKYPIPETITLKLNLPQDLPSVLVDEAQIQQQVLPHLILNAYQAMPDGGQLTVKAEPDADCIHLSFTDTGLGMAPEIIEQIFEPLFTTKAKGIGLGLAVVKKVVEINGGQVNVESVEGQGTTLTLNLPIYHHERPSASS